MNPPWQVEEHGAVDTTQALARAKPAWHAVVATEQRHGRGQRERTFVSDRGGLYLSAVLPYGGDARESRGFALAVGWAVREALAGLGVRDVRLRWPNDLMIGARKAGGILVEQGGPETLVVGIGLNVSNRPWLAAPELRATACSLAEHTDARQRETARLVRALLDALRRAHGDFQRGGFAGLVPRLNAGWGEPRLVTLELAGRREPVRGLFTGVHESGDLVLGDAAGALVRVPEHHVTRLREV